MFAALARIEEGNRVVAVEVRAEARESLRRMEAAAARERATRNDLIRQLKAVERVPKARITAFDPSECAGHDLLDEMSIQVRREHWKSNDNTRVNDALPRSRLIFRICDVKSAM